MVAMHTHRPLEISSFPTLLLIATVLRLGLNVASTVLFWAVAMKARMRQDRLSRPLVNLLLPVILLSVFLSLLFW